MKQISERSTAYLTVAFLDADNNPQTPAAITCRIDDVGSGQEVRPASAVAPASAVTITISPTENAILSDNLRERRRVTVVAVYGTGDQVTGEYIYEVVNLRKVTG